METEHGTYDFISGWETTRCYGKLWGEIYNHSKKMSRICLK